MYIRSLVFPFGYRLVNYIDSSDGQISLVRNYQDNFITLHVSPDDLDRVALFRPLLPFACLWT